jgi:ABC-type phosphate/phosphonate transport system permease subunit
MGFGYGDSALVRTIIIKKIGNLLKFISDRIEISMERKKYENKL